MPAPIAPELADSLAENAPSRTNGIINTTTTNTKTAYKAPSTIPAFKGETDFKRFFPELLRDLGLLGSGV